MKFEIETYRGDLVEEFDYRGIEPYSPEEVRERIRAYAQVGPVFFGLIDGIPQGVAGFVPMDWDNAFAWAFFNPEIKQALKRVMIEIESALLYCKYNLVLAFVPKSGVRFAEVFMKPVGILERFREDEDYFLFARRGGWQGHQ